MKIIIACITLLSISSLTYCMELAKESKQSAAAEQYFVRIKGSTKKFKVSPLLAHASPCLKRKVAKNSAIVLDAENFFPFMGKNFEFELYTLAIIEQMVANENKGKPINNSRISQLSRYEFGSLGDTLCIFGMEDLLAKVLDAYLSRRKPISIQAPSATVSAEEMRAFHAQELTPANFHMMYERAEQLGIVFSPSQHAQLDSVAAFLFHKYGSSTKSLLKELNKLSGQQGFVKRTLLHHIMAQAPNYQAFKIGWRLALEEKDSNIRDGLFEELAFMVTEKHNPHIPKIFWLNPKFQYGNMKDVNFHKAQFAFLYHKLQTLQAGERHSLIEIMQPTYPEISAFHRPGGYLSVFLQVRQQVGRLPLRVVAKNLHSALNMMLNDDFPNYLKDSPAWKCSIIDVLELLAFSHVTVGMRSPLSQEAIDREFVAVTATLDNDSIPPAGPTPAAKKFARVHHFELLMQGARVNVADENGNTFAHKVLAKSLTEFFPYLALLHRNNFKIDMHAKNKNGETPLSLMHKVDPAVFRSKYRLLELMGLAQILEVELSDAQKAACVAAYSPGVKEQIDEKYPAYMAKNIQKGINWVVLQAGTSLSFEQLRTAWLDVLQEKNEPRANAMVVRLRELVRSIRRTENGCFYKGEKLEGSLPSCMCGHQNINELVELVRNLRNGTIVVSQVSDRMTPLDLIELLKFSDCWLSCLCKVPFNGEMTERMLAQARTMGQDPSVITPMLTYLLKGSDINAQDERGNTVAHYAILQGNVRLLDMLISICEQHLDLSKQNKNGCTPLILAAQCETEETDFVGLLADTVLEYAEENRLDVCNILAQDTKGLNALHYFLTRGFSKTGACLKLAGLVAYANKSGYECSCRQKKCASEYKKMAQTLREYPGIEMALLNLKEEDRPTNFRIQNTDTYIPAAGRQKKQRELSKHVKVMRKEIFSLLEKAKGRLKESESEDSSAEAGNTQQVIDKEIEHAQWRIKKAEQLLKEFPELPDDSDDDAVKNAEANADDDESDGHDSKDSVSSGNASGDDDNSDSSKSNSGGAPVLKDIDDCVG